MVIASAAVDARGNLQHIQGVCFVGQEPDLAMTGVLRHLTILSYLSVTIIISTWQCVHYQTLRQNL